jgi:hypothetical protein
MAGSDQDNIIYADTQASQPKKAAGAGALLLAGAVMIGFAILGWGFLESDRDRKSPLSVGFNALSSEIKLCESERQQLRDFSIVVSGIGPGEVAFPQVRQFAIVMVSVDRRYGRPIPTEVLCALP